MVILILLIIIIMGAGIYVLTHARKEAYPPYSSYGPDPYGTKGAFLLLKELGFSVSRTSRSSEIMKDGDVLIVIEPDITVLSKEKEILSVNEWVHRGNTLVLIGQYPQYFAAARYLDPHNQELKAVDFTGISEKPTSKYQEISYGQGSFRLIPDASRFMNEGMREKGNATELVSSLWDLHARKLVFFEYGRDKEFIGMEEREAGKGNILQLLSPSSQLILLQVIMGLLLLAYIAGRRFGLPQPYREEQIREENENALAIGRLMGQAGLKTEALNLYYEEFVQEAAHRMGIGLHDENALVDAWKRQGMGRVKALEDILDCMRHVKAGSQISNDTLLKAFQKLDHLREEIKQNDK